MDISSLINSRLDANRLPLHKVERLQEQAKGSTDLKQLKHVCQEFEAIFIKQMLDSMRKTVPRAELLERNMGEEIFEDMLYTEYSKIMAHRGAIGIADLLFRQLSIPLSKKE